jgi:hypothetical protein
METKRIIFSVIDISLRISMNLIGIKIEITGRDVLFEIYD